MWYPRGLHVNKRKILPQQLTNAWVGSGHDCTYHQQRPLINDHAMCDFTNVLVFLAAGDPAAAMKDNTQSTGTNAVAKKGAALFNASEGAAALLQHSAQQTGGLTVGVGGRPPAALSMQLIADPAQGQGSAPRTPDALTPTMAGGSSSNSRAPSGDGSAGTVSSSTHTVGQEGAHVGGSAEELLLHQMRRAFQAWGQAEPNEGESPIGKVQRMLQQTEARQRTARLAGKILDLITPHGSYQVLLQTWAELHPDRPCLAEASLKEQNLHCHYFFGEAVRRAETWERCAKVMEAISEDAVDLVKSPELSSSSPAFLIGPRSGCKFCVYMDGGCVKLTQPYSRCAVFMMFPPGTNLAQFPEAGLPDAPMDCVRKYPAYNMPELQKVSQDNTVLMTPAIRQDFPCVDVSWGVEGCLS